MRAKVRPERLQLLARLASVATRQDGQTGDWRGTRLRPGPEAYPSDTPLSKLIILIKALRDKAPSPPNTPILSNLRKN